MNRSNRYVFVPFCALAQGVRAQGIVRDYPAVINPIIRMLADNNINIVQMPCPELFFDGFTRRPKQKGAYDTPQNREVYKKVAKIVADQISMLQSAGCEIIAILGIEFSPSCAVSQLTGPPPQRFIKGKGIFIEELEVLLRHITPKPRLIGIRTSRIESTLAELASALHEQTLFPKE